MINSSRTTYFSDLVINFSLFILNPILSLSPKKYCISIIIFLSIVPNYPNKPYPVMNCRLIIWSVSGDITSYQPRLFFDLLKVINCSLRGIIFFLFFFLLLRKTIEKLSMKNKTSKNYLYL